MSKYTLHFKYQAVLHYLHIRSPDHYGISRTHLRRWIRAHREGGIDAADKALLVETYRRHKGCYGQRRIAAALDWNRKKAARLMKQMGLKALIRAKKAYRHPAMGEISEHLLKRRFKARKPNEKWLTDVTELKGKDGKLYLSPILSHNRSRLPSWLRII